MQWYPSKRRCLLTELKNPAVGSEFEDSAEAESESLWLSEAERRQREVREGRVKLVPGDEVKALLDQVLG